VKNLCQGTTNSVKVAKAAVENAGKLIWVGKRGFH
jgi:hypothetical protein